MGKNCLCLQELEALQLCQDGGESTLEKNREKEGRFQTKEKKKCSFRKAFRGEFRYVPNSVHSWYDKGGSRMVHFNGGGEVGKARSGGGIRSELRKGSLRK